MNSYVDNHPFLIEDQSSGNLYYLTGVSNVNSNRNATVTQYPTVSGKSISDNMYVEPKTCGFTIVISSIYGSIQRVVYSESKISQDLTISDIKQFIKDWQTNATRLNITTFEDYFSDMVLNSITTNEDGSSGIGTWSATLQFTEVRVAEVSEVKLEFPANEQESANNNSEQDLGSDNGSTAGEIGSMVGSTGIGAAAGAAIGSIIPGIGTGIGAMIGGAIGFFSWLF